MARCTTELSSICKKFQNPVKRTNTKKSLCKAVSVQKNDANSLKKYL